MSCAFVSCCLQISILADASVAESACSREAITQFVIPVQYTVKLDGWRAGLWQSRMHQLIGKVR